MLRQACSAKHSTRKIKLNKVKAEVDTGGGFILDEEDCVNVIPTKIVEKPTPSLYVDEIDRLHCDECSQEFVESYLHSNFNAFVCDNCRDNKEKHKLISKTEAKTKFLLKDCDFDIREPALKYLVRKNPHYQFGEMKLYLESQINKRTLEVWGSEENLENEHERRAEEQEKRKNKRYQKKMKELRMNVRSSLYKHNLEGHQHNYGPESYDSDADEYTKECLSCGQKLNYEKM
ncbi:DNA repair protein complementing XP-A cells [Nymphon striatum]|nr:DNA repair protein complementing XP-A cells [Nymphon striatum]